MKTAKKAHEILKKRVPPDSNFTEIGWHNELTDIVNEIYEYQQYAQQQPTPPTEPAQSEDELLDNIVKIVKSAWTPDSEPTPPANKKD